ncbi:Uncharacterized small protein [Leminorella richardii]|uniref:Uncharacterized small protein n=1 Tax=Leminorella richardii TaxID=158841 RepID=A0A2X4UB57_9GAMM|nr:DUF2158 domain-containing protein [Leminorella richardii]SQI36393.1 Uncharacterized small protein [Leminorella richardii]
MSKTPRGRKAIYNVGDQVIIKSGGPAMTIEKVMEHHVTEDFIGTYRCQWFAGKKLDMGIFPEESLESYTPKL